MITIGNCKYCGKYKKVNEQIISINKQSQLILICDECLNNNGNKENMSFDTFKPKEKVSSTVTLGSVLARIPINTLLNILKRK